MKKTLSLFILIAIIGQGSILGQLINKRYTGQGGNSIDAYTYLNTSDDGLIVGGHLMTGGAFLTKFDANGDTLWSKTHETSSFGANVHSIIETSNGSLYTVSSDGVMSIRSFNNQGDISFGRRISFNGTSSYISSAQGVAEGNDIAFAAGLGNTDTLVYGKFDGSGNVLWARKLQINSIFSGSSSKNVSVSKIVVNSSGNYVINGKLNTDGGLANYYFMLEADAAGSIIWIKTMESNFGAFGTISPNDLKIASNGDLLLSGSMTYNGAQGAFYNRYDSNGNFIWAKFIQDGSYKTHIIELGSGEIALNIQSSYLTLDGDPKFGLVKTDALGNYMWGRTFGTTSNSNAGGLMQDPSGNIMAVNVANISWNPSLIAYNSDLNGIATSCYDIMTTPTISDWIPVVGTSTTNSISTTTSFTTETITNDYLTLTFSESNMVVGGVITNPLCNEEMGNVQLTVSGGINPFEYSWSNGTNSQNLLNVTNGTYVSRVSDAEGCVELDTFDIVEPTELAVTSIVSDVTCFGSQNGSLDISTTGGTPGYTYLWATQDVTEDISGLSGGFYQVTIVDANGCDEDFGFAISEPQQLFAAITSSQNVTCYGACDGSLTGLGSGGTSPYVLGWNDANNTVGSSVSNLCPGNYLFTVTDDNGCVSYSNGTITEPLPMSSTTATAGSECGVANGEASIDVVGGTMPYAYSWTSGDMSDTAISLTPGSYNVTVTDNNGCMVNESVVVNTLTTPIEICVVTVDSVDNNNMVVWEKPVSQNIQGFYIYRNIAGAYSQVGYQPYDSISQFVDNSFGVDPAVTSYRYEISVLDSCGNESDLSNFHETIHLTSNLGLNDEVNLIWDDYEGFIFSQYNILRDSTGTGDWEQIANVANTSFTFTDLTPPQSGSLRYLVEVVLPSTCSATKAQDHNTTRSNRATISAPNASSIQELILSQVNIYPNPSKGLFTINLKSDNWSYSLFDMSGKLISNEIVSETNKEIDVQELETGIYLMKINLGESAVYKKVIKQ